MIPAILQNKIIQTHLTHKNLLLVYQTTSSKNDLVNIFQQVSSQKVFVYDFNREESHGNGIFSAQAKITFKTPIPQ